MKKLLLVLTTAVALTATVAAQTVPYSMTNYSTYGLFSTDVDNFINVNNWQSVDPENVFAFINYGAGGAGWYNVGAATNYKKYYLAGFMTGRLPAAASSFSTTEASGTTTKSSSSSKDSGDFTMDVFLGSKNMGINFNLSSEVDANDKVKTSTSETVTKMKEVTPTITVGLNTKYKKYNITPYAGLSIPMYIAKTSSKTETAGTVTTSSTNTGYFDLNVFGGSGIDLGKKGIVQNNADVYARIATRVDNNSSETAGVTSKNKGAYAWVFELDPSYTSTVYVAKNFTVKGSVGLDTTLYASGDYDYAESSNGTKSYNTSRKTTAFYGVYPFAKFAAQYSVKPNFTLNLGGNISLPTVTINSTTTKERTDASDATKVTSTKKDKKYNINTYNSDGIIYISDGFTWNVTKNVKIDCSSNVIADCMDMFSTDFVEGYNTNGLWNNLNLLLVHNIVFSVECKF